MIDFLGNEVLAGDKIVYIVTKRTSYYLKEAVVERITTKNVVIDESHYRMGDKFIDLSALERKSKG